MKPPDIVHAILWLIFNGLLGAVLGLHTAQRAVITGALYALNVLPTSRIGVPKCTKELENVRAPLPFSYFPATSGGDSGANLYNRQRFLHKNPKPTLRSGILDSGLAFLTLPGQGSDALSLGGGVTNVREVRRHTKHNDIDDITDDPLADDGTFDGAVDSGFHETGLSPKQYEALKTMLDTIYPVEEGGDEDEGRPLSSVYLKYWSLKPNDRDIMMRNVEEIMMAVEKGEDEAEACKKLGLPEPLRLKPELMAAMIKDRFNLKEGPKPFWQSFSASLGLDKLFAYISGDRDRHRGKNQWPFGIEVKDPNIELKPLSVNALRAYLGNDYYNHLEQLAKRDPENARRISTVIHRIYVPPILSIDMHPERKPSDYELYMDSVNVDKAQCEVYRKFINTYPDLVWPVDDDGFLEIYNLWYPDDISDPKNTLPELMRQCYGPGSDLKPPNFFYRFLALPALSCAAGLALGGLVSHGINSVASSLANLDLGEIMTSNLCAAAIAFSTWFGFSRNMTVKGDLFAVALKNLIENGLSNPHKLNMAAYSGLIPKYDVVKEVERFVIYSTIAASNRAIRLARTGKGIETWNLLAKQVGRVAEVCLPICGVSVYRIIYFVACDLATSELLPCAEGNEVLGREISGDPEFSDDDYSSIYEKVHKEYGLPPPGTYRDRYEKNAMLFTTFCLQAFGNIKNFKRTSDWEIDKYKEFVREIKLLGVSDNAWDNLKEHHMTVSTLDFVEKFSKELEQTGGKFKRIELVREYGFDPVYEFLGETEEQKTTRMQIELQEARDAVKDITAPLGYKLEILKALSIIMYLREEWLLPKYTHFVQQQCTEFIATEIENRSSNIDSLIQGFQISQGYTLKIKEDAISLIAKRWISNNALDHDKLLEIARAAGISDQVTLDAISVAMFPRLMEEISQWDITAVTADQITEIKNRYRCKDLVFINAFCEFIKKSVAETKREMVNARNKFNWNLVERHMTALLRGKTAVSNAVASTIDCKLWYRVERAFMQNIPYMVHILSDEEIVGTGKFEKIENQDWELQDPPPPKSDLQLMDEEFENSVKNIEPLRITGEDTYTPVPKQIELSNLVEKGEIDPEFESIPNVFHVGEKPKVLEYENDVKPEPDPYEMQRPIVTSKDAYASWIVYCYRKRGVNQTDVKTLLTIFPCLEKLVEKSDLHWRRLYARQRLRQKDSLGSKVDWCKELDCDEATARKVCSIAYEEDLLKRTGAIVYDIEDDIGDVEDQYFNPFDPSVYNRTLYLFSQRLPSELELENIKKLHTFFKLAPEDISEIHTKCFSHVLNVHFCKVIKDAPQDWHRALKEELIPLAEQLQIQKQPLDMLLRKAEYDYLMVEANRLMMDRTPGKEFVEKCDFIIDEFKRLNVLSTENGVRQQKFSISSHNNNLMAEIIGAFIISHCDVYGTVDQQKLDDQCAIYGLFREERKEVLNKLGRKFYHMFLRKFDEDKLGMDAFKELEHLHKTYEFSQADIEAIFRTHVGIRVREWYDPEAGLESLKRLIPLIHDKDISYYIPFERSRRIHWFINIMNDCINLGEDKGETRIFTYPPEDFFALDFDGTTEDLDSLQGIVNTTKRALALTSEELHESRIIVAEELGASALKKALKLLQLKGGVYSADAETSKFVRALSVAPPGTIPTVKKELPFIKNYEQIRRVIMMLPCSDTALARCIKLLDEVEKS
ncbi:arginine N-methyltransferase 6-like, putative [Babesia ovis]|uniref:Arginine N-methyltransferase 6-like, putative n=1 Tax=Babesia ovis TaxID=5869 RepID=A0A9W5T916_BABOV|nr:arginine N-methyltransferase 6-like, putative [Babesia ovis]